MVDENNNQSGVSFQGAQQTPGQGSNADPKTSTSAQTKESGKESQEQTFITQADFENKMDSLSSKLSQQIQSYADRSESRLSQQISGANTELDKKFAELAGAGTPVPDNIQQEERERVLREALRTDTAQPPPQDATIEIAGLQLDPKFLDNKEYVNYQAFLLASNTGFIIEPDDPDKVIPKDGVYAVSVLINKQIIKHGMLNVGTNPTFENAKGTAERTIEVNIFDFDADIYGDDIEVEFVDWIRSEVKFNSPKDLVEQLHKDKLAANKILHQKSS